MDKSIFQYIWRNSKGQQLTIMAMTACSFPFLLMALKLPKTIINDAIDGKVFPKDLFDLGLGLGQIEYLLVLCAALFFSARHQHRVFQDRQHLQGRVV